MPFFTILVREMLLPQASWKADPARAALLALYAEVDALLADYSCDESTECCQFGITGREPYPTAAELAEVKHAMAAQGLLRDRGGAPGGSRARGRRSLPIAPIAEEEARDPQRCPLLTDAGRCRIYSSRPFGCRTFFCARVRGPGSLPRDDVQRISRRLADLSARVDPRNPHARPLTNALDEMLRGGGR